MALSQKIQLSGPLHEQVHDALRTRILAGEWDSREPLPGEAYLSQEFGVSVGTVRKAMDRLMRDNIVFRERGRGTFVRNGTEWRNNSVFRLRTNSGDPIVAEIAIVGSVVENADATDVRHLKRPETSWSKMRVLRLFREWRVMGALVCQETIALEESRFPDLAGLPDLCSETLFHLYADVYRVKTETIRWQIGSGKTFCSRATNENYEPALQITRVSLDEKDEPIEVCKQVLSLSHCMVEIMR